MGGGRRKLINSTDPENYSWPGNDGLAWYKPGVNPKGQRGDEDLTATWQSMDPNRRYITGKDQLQALLNTNFKDVSALMGTKKNFSRFLQIFVKF